jgi:hypothetical protein
MIHSLQGDLLGVFSKVCREKGKEGWGREPGWFWHKLQLFLNIQNFQRIFFLKDENFAEQNDECFEIIF